MSGVWWQSGGVCPAENLGVNLEESKQIANRLQDTVVKQQLQEHCEQRRKCLTCAYYKLITTNGRRQKETGRASWDLRYPFLVRKLPCAKPTPICGVHLQQANRRSANLTATDNKHSVAFEHYSRLQFYLVCGFCCFA
jgi:hypothetical protein